MPSKLVKVVRCKLGFYVVACNQSRAHFGYVASTGGHESHLNIEYDHGHRCDLVVKWRGQLDAARGALVSLWDTYGSSKTGLHGGC